MQPCERKTTRKMNFPVKFSALSSYFLFALPRIAFYNRIMSPFVWSTIAFTGTVLIVCFVFYWVTVFFICYFSLTNFYQFTALNSQNSCLLFIFFSRFVLFWWNNYVLKSHSFSSTNSNCCFVDCVSFFIFVLLFIISNKTCLWNSGWQQINLTIENVFHL